MLYKRNAEKKLSKELFENPTSEYRGTPFLSLNCRITKPLLRSQMEVFRRMGFGGAHMHSRTGLENEYMSEEFLELIRYVDEQAKERGMLCWLYDEDRYPSGAAGGIVTENWDYRARHLLMTREKKAGMCATREEFLKAVEQGEKSAGYYLTAYRVKTCNGYLESYRQVKGPQPEFDSVLEEEQEGRLWFAYVELMRESPWFNDQTYVDVMNRDAILRFLELTHERYFEKLGEEFGKSIPAIFTDEPQLKGSMVLPDGESNGDVTLSFTDDLPETYEKEYGIDLLQVLPELLWELPEGKLSVHRYRYHNHLAERFVSAYGDTIADWCEKHGIALTGHYMSEPTLFSQTLRLGEAMRCYRRQQLPGVDILCGDPEYSTIKQAVSVAHQNGREGVLSELYGVNHWDFDFKGHKLQGDWQAALGVTIRCHHLAFLSMEGESKRDWPASINYQSPWWKDYPYIEDYFARVNTAMTRGKAKVDVVVIHPIESYWIAYGPVAQTQSLRDQMDENFKNLINWLLFGLVDFDFISESLLPEQAGGMKVAGTEQGTLGIGTADRQRAAQSAITAACLNVGEMSYRTVLVPGLRTIRSTTLDYLEAFVKAGGRVIFIGEIPVLVDGLESDRAMRLAERARRIPFNQYDLLEALEEDRSVEIRYDNGRRSDNLFYQMRKDGESNWLFVCHVNRKRNRIDQPERMRVRLKGAYQVTVYDALTGEIRELLVNLKAGWTEVLVELYAEDSFLWKLEPCKELAICEKNSSEGQQEIESSRAKLFIGNVQDEDDQITNVQKVYPVKTGGLAPFYGLVASEGGSAVWKKTSVIDTIYEPEDFRLAEPNVLLLDSACWSLDGGVEQPKEEILRLDNEIRTILGYPHRQDAYTQPWRIRSAPEDHLVRLRYEIDSEIDTDALYLAMERPQKAKIWLNGQLCSDRQEVSDANPGQPGRDQEEWIFEKEDFYVDSFIKKTALSGLRTGKNELILEIVYGRKTNLENIYLLGDFGVEVRGAKAVVVSAPKKLAFGDITRQKLPFYGGNVVYQMRFTLDQEQEIEIRVPHFVSPVLEVSLDGEKSGLIAFAPHTLKVGKLSAGTHRLEITACGNRFNSFGTLHNCNDEFQWYGPDSYRTQGSEWSESWCLRPFGILSRVEILS